ncbi:AAA family ATPase [Streptomyces lasalocidi]
MIEREAEFAELNAAFDESISVGVRVVVVHGAAANGKTALIDNFACRVRAVGARLLRASGAPTERALSLGIVRQLLVRRDLRRRYGGRRRPTPRPPDARRRGDGRSEPLPGARRAGGTRPATGRAAPRGDRHRRRAAPGRVLPAVARLPHPPGRGGPAPDRPRLA